MSKIFLPNPSTAPQVSLHESDRIKTLRNLQLLEAQTLDTAAEQELLQLVQLASQLCGTPISLVSIVDSDRVWFKANIGLDLPQTSRKDSFCSHAIQQPDLFIVEDAAIDTRFYLNSLVTSDVNIRFYAGMPIHAPNGAAIGTLCVLDTKPRVLTADQKQALTILGLQLQAKIQARAELRQQRAQLQQALAELSLANTQLEIFATTDPLTGLTNRRAFQPRIENEFATARQGRHPLTLIMMDVDNFKQRNDQYGHAAGDEALAFIGSILRQTIRSTDTAVRMAGEEFAILMPGVDAHAASKIAHRIQNALRKHPQAPANLTMSVGIASTNQLTPDWQQLFSKADNAMDQAKRSGKNRIITGSVTPPPPRPQALGVAYA